MRLESRCCTSSRQVILVLVDSYTQQPVQPEQRRTTLTRKSSAEQPRAERAALRPPRGAANEDEVEWFFLWPDSWVLEQTQPTRWAAHCPDDSWSSATQKRKFDTSFAPAGVKKKHNYYSHSMTAEYKKKKTDEFVGNHALSWTDKTFDQQL